eukprot:5101484-Pleurochrysis_carterae.AAC.1
MSQNVRGENSRLSDELNVRGENSRLSVELNGQSIGLHAARVKLQHKKPRWRKKPGKSGRQKLL